MYSCEHCRRPIGLMADVRGVPTLYKCPRRYGVGGPQEPIRRETTKRKLKRKTKEKDVSAFCLDCNETSFAKNKIPRCPNCNSSNITVSERNGRML